MRKLFLVAFRGQALMALSFLLAISAGGNAQGDRSRRQTEPTDTAEKVSRLTAALKDRTSWRSQCQAAQALAELGPEARGVVPALAAALKDPERHVRIAAARALGKVGTLSPETLAALKVAAKDEDASVRDVATEACYVIFGKATKEDVPALLTALKDREPLIHLPAARALGKAGSLSPDTLAALKLAAKDEDTSVREAVSDVWQRLLSQATKEELLPALLTSLKAPDRYVRSAAVGALGKVRSLSPDTLATLKAAAEEEDASVGDVVTKACDVIFGNANKEDVPALLTALKDPDRSLRIVAARALGKASPSPEALAALKAAAKDEDTSVRKVATWACYVIFGNANKEDVPTLLTALKDPDRYVRSAAACALGKVGSLSPDTLAALKTAAKDEDTSVREAVTDAWQRLLSQATKEDLPALLTALKDPERSLRIAAARALGKVGSLSPDTLAALLTALKDPDRYVRIAAARALGTVGKLRPLSPETLTALKSAAKDEDALVRQTATEVWESLPNSMVMLALEPPLVEAYLQQGRLAAGETTLLERLKKSPRDDQARFGLGVLQFVRGVERLGQSLHKYGTRSEDTNIPFLRLPVPRNPDPAPINDTAFRRVLAEFHRDLSAAEATLAGVTDDKVKLPLRLAAIHLDLVGVGKPDDRFIDILKKIMHRQQFDLLESNPEFVVGFDRGDVAWMRAYCHLLMGMLDFYLSFDTEQLFNLSADKLFAKPERRFRGEDAEELAMLPAELRLTILLAEVGKGLAVKEPARLRQFRRHLIKVAELNRETWKHIRAETDDDHEWLPNPRQKGVLGLPVQTEMIDAWLAMMAELEALLDGKLMLPAGLDNKDGKGLNLKTLLDDPPEKLVLDPAFFFEGLPDKYWSEGKAVAPRVLRRAFEVFGDPTSVGYYAAWFN
jgi:HEAT repeat protein